ncbi:hypothetical protein F5X99DRAFT_372745 [Biscogniauxia marginata]|nr:hypothetical protein F5X99DRAFT_372745 [Biscogniauxia marginata]
MDGEDSNSIPAASTPMNGSFEAVGDVSSHTDEQSKGHPPSKLDTTVDSGLEIRNGEHNISSSIKQVSQNKECDNEDEIEPHPSWQIPVPLYCPKNGRSHSVLLDFGYVICPKCSQDLTKKPDNGSDAHDSDTSTSICEDVDERDDRAEGTDEVANISFSVEYRDSGDNSIFTVPWTSPFNLDTERSGIWEKKTPIFDVVTVVKTTVESGSRYFYEASETAEKEILHNPAIGVTVETSRMVINSPAILKAITSVVSYYPSVNLEGETISIEEPYPLIAHHLAQLEEYRDRVQNAEVEKLSSQANSQFSVERGVSMSHAKDASTHLDLLLNFVKTSVYKDDIRDEMARYDDRMTCTFRMLWLLFKPGDTVYCETRGDLAAYVVTEVRVDPSILSKLTKKSPYVITMWSLDFDGQFVGRCARQVIIPHFEGERAITTLQVFPCEYVDKKDGGKTREKLEQYGKQWYELLVGAQVHYSGKLLDAGNKECQGRVYIDNVSYYSEYPRDAPDVGDIDDMGEGLSTCPCEECKGQRTHPPSGFRWAQYDVLDPRKDKNLETDGLREPLRHRYLLCPRELRGLVLKSRNWETLDVANCSSPRVNTRAIQSLVMPAERKTLIEALVQRFSNNSTTTGAAKPWRADYMENKGEGQIFLLHGGPGVGKTFTAECIAEYTGRALLSLTCGDIGTDEKRVEANLTKWFKLAEVWGAVMLIDEADVYLERRQITDLKRNSLVSVFLRCIEYYRGILFLTTNRVGTFDDAFMSRIHIVIAYESLGKKEREMIWRQFFDKLSEDRQDITITSRAKNYVLKDQDMTEVDWNGREIRNAFQTAVALAEYRFLQKKDKSEDDQPVLDQRDFEQVLDMTSQFKKYLTNVHGVNEADRAFIQKTRALSQQPEL